MLARLLVVLNHVQAQLINPLSILQQVKPIVIDNLTLGIMKVVNDALSRYPIGNLTVADEFDNWKSNVLQAIVDPAIN